jgi:hypothetical protein
MEIWRRNTDRGRRLEKETRFGVRGKGWHVTQAPSWPLVIMCGVSLFSFGHN